MTDTEQKDIVAPQPEAPVSAGAAPAGAPARTDYRGGERRGPRGGKGRGNDRRGPRKERERREFDQRILEIRRVSRTVAGGRRFNFSVAIVIGDKKGKVGVGLGKAGDTSLAIDKATRDAKKNMFSVALTKDSSIAHDIEAKFSASHIKLTPSPGRGLVAGSSVRPVLELAGVTNVVGKIHSGSKNKLNNARAAVKALQSLKA